LQAALASPRRICYIQSNTYPLSPPAESAKLKFGGVHETLEDFRIDVHSAGVFAFNNPRASAGANSPSPRYSTRRRRSWHSIPDFAANRYLHKRG
jgi:hypothetical protein